MCECYDWGGRGTALIFQGRSGGRGTHASSPLYTFAIRILCTARASLPTSTHVNSSDHPRRTNSPAHHISFISRFFSVSTGLYQCEEKKEGRSTARQQRHGQSGREHVRWREMGAHKRGKVVRIFIFWCLRRPTYGP